VPSLSAVVNATPDSFRIDKCSTPALGDAQARKKFFAFFTVPIRNANTRAAYSLLLVCLELKSDSFSYRTQLHSIPKLQHYHIIWVETALILVSIAGL
jgi:hypothetical protein